MKKTLPIFALIMILLGANACKHQPKFTADTLPAQQMRWGSGGGFAGKENVYTLLQNGQIFQRDAQGNLVERKKTKAKKAAAIYKTARELKLADLDFNYPGNVYSFLEWQDGDAIRRIVWGDPKIPANRDVKAVFDQMNALLK
jgi:hypothetical protein